MSWFSERMEKLLKKKFTPFERAMLLFKAGLIKQTEINKVAKKLEEKLNE